MEVAAVYAGLLAGLAGIVSLAKPLRFLGIRTRRAAAGVLALGLALAAAGELWPASPVKLGGDRSRLDDFVPACQFREFHETRVHASPRALFRAVKAVTADEIRFFRLLTWIRSPRFFETRGRNILSPPADRPLLEVALHTGFVLLAEEPDREIVFGTVFGNRSSLLGEEAPREFARLDREGTCKVAMNFRLREEPGGWIRLSTETRVFANGASARRAFARYWRLIYPGSAVIRRMWLAAIRRRAENARGACAAELEALTHPVNKALDLFESGGGSAAKEPLAAQQVLSEAKLAREKLEATSAEPPCLRARQEELVFLNHLILGFQAYVGSGRDSSSRGALESIIRRARVHQERGRTGT